MYVGNIISQNKPDMKEINFPFTLSRKNMAVKACYPRGKAGKFKMWVHRGKTEVSVESDASITLDSYFACKFRFKSMQL